MQTTTPESTQPNLRILYLEDEEHDRELAAATMAAAGVACTFVYAKTELEFQAALDQHSFDVVLSDFSLPSYSGMAALALVKEKQLETPFLLVSGTIGEQRAVESLKAGAIDYVLKDRLDRLPGAVQRALREAGAIATRKQAERSLRESEARFRQLAENINQVFWISNHDLTELLYVSPAYEKIWGRPCQEVYERPMSFAEAIHSEDRDRVLASVEGHKQTRPYDEQYRIVRPDGAVRWIHALGFPVRNENGEVYRLAGLAADVTE
jgi:two-component system, cell cycle sensor histidine kinase and response regulator CckA